MSDSEKLLNWSSMTEEEKERNKREFDLLLENLRSEDSSYSYANSRFDYIIVALCVGGISMCYTSINNQNKNYFIVAIIMFILSIIVNIINQRISMSMFSKTREHYYNELCVNSGIENDYKPENWDKENAIIPVLDYISIGFFCIGILSAILSLTCRC